MNFQLMNIGRKNLLKLGYFPLNRKMKNFIKICCTKSKYFSMAIGVDQLLLIGKNSFLSNSEKNNQFLHSFLKVHHILAKWNPFFFCWFSFCYKDSILLLSFRYKDVYSLSCSLILMLLESNCNIPIFS